mmetsp:Transcript_88782/g.129831  ORF Transcript_88782/g.129831 Transcript_88782/m.129831 type:complete len:242 (-) Transcript_88782:28-753(-)
MLHVESVRSPQETPTVLRNTGALSYVCVHACVRVRMRGVRVRVRMCVCLFQRALQHSLFPFKLLAVAGCIYMYSTSCVWLVLLETRTHGALLVHCNTHYTATTTHCNTVPSTLLYAHIIALYMHSHTHTQAHMRTHTDTYTFAHTRTHARTHARTLGINTLHTPRTHTHTHSSHTHTLQTHTLQTHTLQTHTLQTHTLYFCLITWILHGDFGRCLEGGGASANGCGFSIGTRIEREIWSSE